MKVNTIFLILVFFLVLFFCFMLARLNQDDVSLDLLFIEIQNKLGLVILISFLAGALLTFVLEILYSLRKNKGD